VIEELDRELRAVGVPARRRRRIRLELEDHLACDPGADLGNPRELARQFADELGSVYARRAGVAVFLALVPVGVLVCVLALSRPGVVFNVGATLGGQLAFVGGTLALLRAWRLERQPVITAAEGRVIARRGALGILGGVITLAAVAVSVRGDLAWATLGVGCVALAAAAVALAATRLRPSATGRAGDLAFDLGIVVDPWLLALVIAAGVALCIALGGVIQSDPLDGLARAAGDAVLCLAGFALLCRPLGLRESTLRLPRSTK